MASRDSQGLQIALILFVMVSVVLAVTTFVFYRGAEEAGKTLDDALAKKKTATDSFLIENFKVQYLLHIVGAKTMSKDELESVESNIVADETMQVVMSDFAAAMSTYGEATVEGDFNYSTLPKNMILHLSDKNRDNTLLTLNIKEAKEKSEKEIATAATLTANAEDGRRKAANELATARDVFNKDLAAVQAGKDDMNAKFQVHRDNLQKTARAQETVLSQRQADISSLNKIVKNQSQTIIEMRDEPFEVADGRIAWVNQGSATVWINLGLADGLRRQTLFSVYDMAENGVSRSERKASIEVTKVLDQHLAEARIVYDAAADPILPGDQVFSPAWRPGRKVRFALAGIFDIDGDRRSDRDLIRNLITMSGAVIDAEVHDDGTVEGELTTSTRYLVQGDRPTEGSDAKTLAAFGSMIGKARDYGVEIIPIDKLLSWMGYNPEVRTLGLGKNADPSQFRIPPAEGRARESLGGKFREREPPKNGKGNSAYR